MNKIIPMATALALALGASTAATAQNQGERGGDRGQQEKGGGRGEAKANRGPDRAPDRGGNRGQDARGPDGRDQERPARAARPARAERPDTPAVTRAARGPDQREQNGRGRDDAREQPPVVRDLQRRAVAGPGDLTVFRLEPDRGLIAGCPPGLAKRNNGCLPPGQERQIARARYDYLWGSRDDGVYRYDNGYLYRFDRQGSVLGWLPALGGALSPGNVWPAQYGYQPVPQYYTNYFRLNDPYDYRYADGALYGLDPRTQAISQVAALLTGQPITVGQPMPAGYDVYNVPYAYRGQYVDTADSRYRYNDGYVYRVDPTTQLVQAAIQLIT